jgi:hypothetical protein
MIRLRLFPSSGRNFIISDKPGRATRRARDAHEIEENQQNLRTSIDESKRLVDEADAMIRRHRHECDAAEDK